MLLFGAEGACVGDATLDVQNAVCFSLLNAGATVMLWMQSDWVIHHQCEQ